MVDAMQLRLEQLLSPTAAIPLHPALRAPGAVGMIVVDSSSSGNRTANVATAISSALLLSGGVISKNSTAAPINGRANSLIGIGYSDPTEAFASAALAYSLPVCDGGATSPALSNRADYPNFFRVIPNDNKAALAILGLVKGFGWQKIAITSSSDSYGEGLLTSAQRYASEFGITVLTSQSFSPGNTDFTSIIDRIVESEATIILHLGFADDLTLILEAATARGLAATGAYQWITGDDANYIDMSRLTPAQRSMWSGVWMVYPREGVGAEYDAFSAAFLARYINVPNRKPWYSGQEAAPPSYAGFYSACIEAYVWAWDAALQSGNASFSQLAAQNYTLAVPEAYNFSDRIGVTGNLTLDEDGDRVATYRAFYYNINEGRHGAFHKFAAFETASRALTVDEAPLFYMGRSTPLVHDTLQVLKIRQAVEWASVLGVVTVVMTLVLAVGILCLAAIVVKNRKNELFKAAAVVWNIYDPPYPVWTIQGKLALDYELYQFNAAHVVKVIVAHGSVLTTACVLYLERCQKLWQQLYDNREMRQATQRRRRKTSMEELIPGVLRPATKSGQVFVAERQSFVSVWTQRMLILHADKGFALISGDHASDGLLTCRYIPLEQFTIATSINSAEQVFTLCLVHLDDWVSDVYMRVLTLDELEGWSEALSTQCSEPQQGAPPATLYTCEMNLGTQEAPEASEL
ncbi:hypothetical protein HDU86_003992 [Geranomyces michiganensis]|nr:hypothetical protein HDU86_003992 [Geranomyces michiganensis]